LEEAAEPPMARMAVERRNQQTMIPDPIYTISVDVRASSKQEAWSKLNALMVDAVESKYRRGSSEWPDYISTSDGKLKVVKRHRRTWRNLVCACFGCRGSWYEICRRCGQEVPPMY
jgi:hypothetical protein